MEKKLVLSSSPHVASDDSVKKIMWTVNASLIPAIFAAYYYFGLKALILIGVSIITAVITEAACEKFMNRPITISDGSAVLTGILLAFCVPAKLPWWAAAVGSFFAVAVVKQVFGGLGYNIFNPALAGRTFLLAAYPVLMTSWSAPEANINILPQKPPVSQEISVQKVDTTSSATPLAELRIAREQGNLDKIKSLTTSSQIYKNLIVGNRSGSLGETSVICLLIGAAILFLRGIITWHIPFSYIFSVFIFVLIFEFFGGKSYMSAFYYVLSGGLILGAFFMATDMVTSPVTLIGRVLFGVGAGLLTVLIRYFSGPPEGVAYSILIMNATTPLIDRYTRPKIFGFVKPIKTK